MAATSSKKQNYVASVITPFLQDWVNRSISIAQEADTIGIDLDYEPQVLTPDISKQTVQEWQDEMNDLITASSAPALAGASHFDSPESVVASKISRYRETPDASKQYMFDFGHVMEEPLAHWYENVTGFKVYEDRARYVHPKYPWLGCDLDRRVFTSFGEDIIMEIKSTNAQTMMQWKSGIYGKSGQLGNPGYIYQATLQMAIMNKNMVVFVAGCSNMADENEVVYVPRDLEREKNLIETLNKYYDMIQNGEIPDPVTCRKEVFDKLCAIEVKAPDPAEAKTVLNLDQHIYGPLVDEYRRVSSEKSDLAAKVKELTERENALKLQILKGVGTASLAHVDGFDINCSERTTVTVDRKKLEALYPDVAKDVEKSSFSRNFRVKAEKAKK